VDHPHGKARFERAWFATGASVVNGSPFLGKNDFKDWMILEKDEKGKPYSAGTVDNYTKPSYPNGMVGILMDAEMIAPEGDGWIVINNVYSSSLMSRK
jgi:hypothetical protein